ncbi:MAG: MaoC family dehydratase [Myxococcota bacterium]
MTDMLNDETVARTKKSEIVIEVGAFKPRAQGLEPIVDKVIRPTYGHVLEDFVPGTVFVHPRGATLDRGFMLGWAKTFMEANPLYLNQAYAQAIGYASLPAAPHLVMNLALSLGVQNDSEKAIANLGYYDVRFLRPVYAGDTLRGMTRIVERKDRGVGKPGIVTVETLAENQDEEVVVQYRRKIMVPRGGDGPIASDEPSAAAPDASAPAFPWKATPKLHIPFVKSLSGSAPLGLTRTESCLGAFEAGQIWVHANGRTVTDEHVGLTYQAMNTHPLHYDRLYSRAQAGPMSGEPIVYGGLVFAWLLGLASRDISENAVWELGFHDGYHTQPTFAGDTLSALTRILSVEPLHDAELGIVRMQLVGVKNLRAGDALDRFGADLFVAEDEKKKLGKEKIPEKVFEIERALLVRKSPA